MKKLLFSFMLMIVFSVPFITQAETITAPVYKVDVMQPAEGIGLNKAVAANVDKSASILRSMSQLASVDANIKKTLQKPTMILIGQCVSCHDNNANEVSGGDFIGGRPS